jgi:hypothetical protein
MLNVILVNVIHPSMLSAIRLRGIMQNAIILATMQLNVILLLSLMLLSIYEYHNAY